MDGVEPALIRNGVDSAVLVQTGALSDETVELLELSTTHKRLAGVIGWVDLTSDSVNDLVACLRLHPAAREGHLLGVRHQTRLDPDPNWLSHPKVRSGLRTLADAGLTFDLLIRADQLESAVETARALPSLKLVLDHALSPEFCTAGQKWIHNLARLPNVAAKLSGFASGPTSYRGSAATIQPWINWLLSAFGPHRLMFASDWPACLLQCSYDETIATIKQALCALNATESEAIMGGTAIEWYGIKV